MSNMHISSNYCIIGLSCVIRKDLFEARVNLEVCSYLDPPGESRVDALSTPNLADEPTLANGPPIYLPVDLNGNFGCLPLELI